MKRTNWFDRQFSLIQDNGLFPGILERLEGTAARLRSKMAIIGGDLARSEDGLPAEATSPAEVLTEAGAKAGRWSIKKEVGHLLDLEPLWHERALQIIGDETHLLKADLTNRKTHETDHDQVDITDLISRFAAEREKLMGVLSRVAEADLEKSALHPRLGTPMRLIDLAFFVAEHDDHHLAQITHLANLR